MDFILFLFLSVLGFGGLIFGMIAARKYTFYVGLFFIGIAILCFFVLAMSMIALQSPGVVLQENTMVTHTYHTLVMQVERFLEDPYGVAADWIVYANFNNINIDNIIVDRASPTNPLLMFRIQQDTSTSINPFLGKTYEKVDDHDWDSIQFDIRRTTSQITALHNGIPIDVKIQEGFFNVFDCPIVFRMNSTIRVVEDYTCDLSEFNMNDNRIIFRIGGFTDNVNTGVPNSDLGRVRSNIVISDLQVGTIESVSMGASAGDLTESREISQIVVLGDTDVNKSILSTIFIGFAVVGFLAFIHTVTEVLMPTKRDEI